MKRDNDNFMAVVIAVGVFAAVWLFARTFL